MLGAAPGYSSAQAMAAMEQAFNETMPPGMGFDYLGMSYQGKKGPARRIASVNFWFVDSFRVSHSCGVIGELDSAF
jgi:hypothetical protein